MSPVVSTGGGVQAHFFLSNFSLGKSSIMDSTGNQYIVTSDGGQHQPLPDGCFIKLTNNLGYMRLRRFPSVLRMHKYGRDDAENELYSEVLFYRPFRREEDLPLNDFDECLRLFLRWIQEKLGNQQRSKGPKLKR